MLNKNEKYKTAEQDTSDDIHSRSVRAGRRTYFFDVKSTRGGDWYIILTESRKVEGKDGIFYYEKNKIHLYKEDFDKFSGLLSEVIDYIKERKPFPDKSEE